MITASNRERALKKRDLLKGFAVGLVFTLVSMLILEIEFYPNELAQLEAGNIAPLDIVAPNTTSYESPIATEAERDRAEKLMGEVYGSPDPKVASEQRVVASQVFNYLDAVRVDPFLSAEQKIGYILAIEPVNFTPDEAAAVLNLKQDLWADAKRAIDVIISEVMRQEIRETNLANIRFNLLPLNVPPDVPEAEANIILAMAADLIQPNSFVDEARTNEARQKAREAVQPVPVAYEKNQIVVRAGERVTDLTIEALGAMGLLQPTAFWRNFVSTFLWLTLLVSGLGYYLVKYQPDILRDNQKLGFLAVISLVFVIVIRIMVPGQDDILPYAVPMAALTITVAGAFDSRLAMVMTLIMGLIEGYAAGGSFELVAYVVLTGLIVSLQVEPMAQVNNLLWAGLYAALSNVVIILIFRFVETDRALLTTDYLLNLTSQLSSGFLGGIVSAGLALIFFFLIGNLTPIVTHIQLLELSRPTHPLLSELLRRAPGTYHHSLVVGNLAEQAAIRVGANVFLCRVGAYYHDVGKMARPYFFTENTPPGVSLHENLDPETSAQIIISHVTEGLRLAKKHRLPQVLHAFIAEHHGTEMVSYFYHQAVQEADGDESQVDQSAFCYPGPKPQSKETAILMLADSSEATVRSVQPHSNDEIDAIVRKTITSRMKSGQFDECDLTMHDLEQIRIAFNEVLQGVSHPRVRYPEQVEKEAKVEADLLPAVSLTIQAASGGINNEAEVEPLKPKTAVPRQR